MVFFVVCRLGAPLSRRRLCDAAEGFPCCNIQFWRIMVSRFSGMVSLEVAKIGCVTGLQADEGLEASTACEASAEGKAVHAFPMQRPKATTNQDPATTTECLWRKFFDDPTQWWDHRRDKLHPDSPDFKHKSTREVLWVDDWYTPEWVTDTLGTILPSMKTGPGTFGICTSFSGECDPEKAVYVRSSPRNEYSWTALISQYTKRGQNKHAVGLYKEMVKSGVKPLPYTFVALLKACSRLQDLEIAKHMHSEVVKSGFESDLYVGTMLVDVYVKCGSLVDARYAFDNMPQRNVVSWTTMILGYAKRDNGEESLQLFARMQQEGVLPDAQTYVSVLKACCSLAESGERNSGDNAAVRRRCLETVRGIHSDVEQGEFEMNIFVGSMLVDAYAKCGSLDDARRVFEKMPHRNVVSWTALIFGYAQMKKGDEGLQLFTRMQKEGVVPDGRTYVSVLKACSSLAELEDGNELDGIAFRERCLDSVRAIHVHIVKRKYDSDLLVGNMLVDVYAKCGSLEDARHLFEKMPNRDVVSWNTMIFGYAQMGKGDQALQLFARMEQEHVVPNDRTFVGALKACGILQGLEKGREIHAQILRAGHDVTDPFVVNCLIDMYGKCGSMVDAQQVFDATSTKDIVAWSALIAGYALQGESDLVFELFEKVKQEGLQPDGITFLGVLSVCCHLGLVDTGQKHFEAMSRVYGITPTVKHFTCMVDLLGRAGHFDKAMEMVKSMPFQRSSAVWTCLLAACQKWRNIELGRVAFEHAVRLDKHDAAAYMMMSNIYASTYMREEATKIQEMRVKSGAWKQPGRSWWMDVNGIIHVFMVGDRGQLERRDIFAEMEELMVKIRQEGYVPYLDLVVLRDISVDKQDILCGHSEKLATAYAILTTAEPSVLG